MKTTKMKKAVATAAVAEESEIGGRGGGEEEEEEQEDCSASPSCLRPTGKEVRYFRKGAPSSCTFETIFFASFVDVQTLKIDMFPSIGSHNQ